jgi:hypothetical protein
MMTSTARALALAAALVAVSGTAAVAQTGTAASRSNTTGVAVGIFANGSAIDSDASDEMEQGGGLGLHLGYGISQHVSIFARGHWFVAETSDPAWESRDYTVQDVGIGLRASLGTRATAARPFAQIMWSRREFEIELGDIGNLGTVTGDGVAFSAGVGLEWFVAPTFAVEGSLSHSRGSFEGGGGRGGYWHGFELDATITRLDLGVTWHPQLPR